MHKEQICKIKEYERFRLKFKGAGLANLDGFFDKSDPILFLLEKTKYGDFSEFGRTERIDNNLNPEWKTTIDIDYDFARIQTMRIDVYDEDKNGKLELIGSQKFDLSQVIKREKSIFLLKKKGKDTGKVVVKSEQVDEKEELLSLDFAAKSIKNVEWFGISDPFLRFFRAKKEHQKTNNPKSLPEEAWEQSHQTGYIDGNLNPDWAPFSISSKLFCHSNNNCPIKVEIWDYSMVGDHVLISTGYFTLEQIEKKGLKVIKTKDTQGKIGGEIIVESLKRAKKHNLTSYLRKGLEISTVVALDFTGSNKDYKDPESLHNIDGKTPNQYLKVISALGSVLEYYDEDNMIPVYGFGAKSKKFGIKKVSHCFPVSGDIKKVFAKGIRGVLKIYKNAVPHLRMLGPTYFSPIVSGIAKSIKHKFEKDPNSYCLLMIITDGLICDMQDTIDAIVQSSKWPLSVLIIGVGDEDFSQMSALDEHGSLLRGSDGKVALRDNIHFIDFKEVGYDAEKLVDSVLGDIPGQITEFYHLRGLTPGCKK